MKEELKEQQFEALQTANEYIENLIKGIEDCIKYLRADRVDEGANLIPLIVEGIQWIYDVVRLTKDVQKDEIDEKEIENKFEELVEAIENQDFVLIADLFEYEILPVLNSWKAYINSSTIS